MPTYFTISACVANRRPFGFKPCWSDKFSEYLIILHLKKWKILPNSSFSHLSTTFWEVFPTVWTTFSCLALPCLPFPIPFNPPPYLKSPKSSLKSPKLLPYDWWRQAPPRGGSMWLTDYPKESTDAHTRHLRQFKCLSLSHIVAASHLMSDALGFLKWPTLLCGLGMALLKSLGLIAL